MSYEPIECAVDRITVLYGAGQLDVPLTAMYMEHTAHIEYYGQGYDDLD